MLKHSGIQVAITPSYEGPIHRCPFLLGAKGKHVAHSTLEAEFVAADYGLRTDGLLALSVWRVLFLHQPPLLFHEDSPAMLRVVSIGKNPTIRYMVRTHPWHGYMKCVK